MAPEHIIDVERSGSKAFAYRQSFRRGDEQKHGAWINEAADEPGAGDTVDLWSSTCDPDGLSRRITDRELFSLDQEPVGRSPGFEATFERFRLYSQMT